MSTIDRNVCRNIEIRVRETILELLGQTYAKPMHYIQYRDLINIKNIKEKGLSKELIGGEIIIVLSFKENEKDPLTEYEFTIDVPYYRFRNIDEFIDCIRSKLMEKLWEYVDRASKSNGTRAGESVKISVPETMKIFYKYDEHVVDPRIEEYIIPRVGNYSHPAAAAVIAHVLLDMFKKFLKYLANDLTQLNLDNIENIRIKFEKKITIDTSSYDNNYIDIDKIDDIKNGIKAIFIESRKSIEENIIKNPSSSKILKINREYATVSTA